jgi:hypothetical protein
MFTPTGCQCRLLASGFFPPQPLPYSGEKKAASVRSLRIALGKSQPFLLLLKIEVSSIG